MYTSLRLLFLVLSASVVLAVPPVNDDTVDRANLNKQVVGEHYGSAAASSSPNLVLTSLTMLGGAGLSILL